MGLERLVLLLDRFILDGIRRLEADLEIHGTDNKLTISRPPSISNVIDIEIQEVVK